MAYTITYHVKQQRPTDELYDGTFAEAQAKAEKALADNAAEQVDISIDGGGILSRHPQTQD